MTGTTDTWLSEQDQVLSHFLGKEACWSKKKHELYAELVKKKFTIDTESDGGITTVSVTAFGFTVSARHSEPFQALTDAAVRALQFHDETLTGAISLPKEAIPFSVAYHWLLRGLDIRRTSWPKGKYISLALGLVADKGSVSSYLPDELFKVVDDTPLAVMPRLVATDGEQQARYDWCAIGVDIMAIDWEAF